MVILGRCRILNDLYCEDVIACVIIILQIIGPLDNFLYGSENKLQLTKQSVKYCPMTSRKPGDFA